MSKAIGLIEFNTTPKGMEAADAMLKASEVQCTCAIIRSRCRKAPGCWISMSRYTERPAMDSRKSHSRPIRAVGPQLSGPGWKCKAWPSRCSTFYYDVSRTLRYSVTLPVAESTLMPSLGSWPCGFHWLSAGSFVIWMCCGLPVSSV